MSGVYGTQGSAEERQWAYNKARFDAETWWYRGNGVLDLVSDAELNRTTKDPEKSLVFYGNLKTNSAIQRHLGAETGVPPCPLSSTDDTVKLGRQVLNGHLGIIWSCSPGNIARMGVIGGTTLQGSRALDRVPIFLSGAHFPDVYVVEPDMYLKGSKGVRAVASYGFDWTLESGILSVRD